MQVADVAQIWQLLWLWRRPAATAPIRPPAWEPPHAASAAPKSKKKKERKKKDLLGRSLHTETGPSLIRYIAKLKKIMSSCIYSILLFGGKLYTYIFGENL